MNKSIVHSGITLDTTKSTEGHRCPICKGSTTKEIEKYVMGELAKLALDPTYLPKIYDGDRK